MGVFLLQGGSGVFAQAAEKIPPTQSDVRYGPHERNLLDFWRAESERPTPLVFLVHGGGWNSGDKERANVLLNIPDLQKNNISVVSINYRYIAQAMKEGVVPPVKAPMDDATRALQFIRTKAKEWNIDSSCIIGSGGSAGACTVLWLALQDDMADPSSADPVLRESTRLAGAVLGGAQTTLDPVQMREWIPGITYGAHAFGFLVPGVNVPQAFEKFLQKRESILSDIKKYSPIESLSADDPPLWLTYGEKKVVEKGEDLEEKTHSVQFGLLLAEKCKALGVPCVLEYPGINNGVSRTSTEIILEAVKKIKK